MIERRKLKIGRRRTEPEYHTKLPIGFTRSFRRQGSNLGEIDRRKIDPSTGEHVERRKKPWP